jgi:UDP-3-O-[3-hydroxymyristoyl] glucosamine N-acyltransferase
MADPRFFKKSKSFSAGELASALGCTLSDESASAKILEDVASLKTATAQDLSFLDNRKYKADFIESKAGACIVSAEMVAEAPKGMICLVSKNPYKTYALAAQMFYPDEFPAPHTAPTAYIHPTAKIGKGCTIGHNVFIGPDVEIGEGCWLETGCVIENGVKIGKGCRIGVNTTVSHATLGNNIRLYTGVRIGQDGFGFAIDPAGHVKVPQLGRVIIGDKVEIGANTTIDRGAGPDTVIGAGTWIDNLVQIGHNVVIGKGCVIVAQVGISGSTIIGDYVALGGQTGVAGHLKIGMGARVAGKSGVMRDLPPGQEYMGYPAIPMKQHLRQIVALNNLIKPKKSD